ncbi:UDP-N-acetylmuramoyl-tripeptide--D-alanyl-D-alanine ligase [Acidisoma cellulosilytica]|uniref:UDP-N-acetylmuramoyl-tripeptide--D-alanyl-D-alanine ligase n=1 Tax=Acidisoma cellulosilyticum TaxID=2802395 RepID=A0A964E1R4_9PROT|nr:UDP-N-acetylmuramoyl-tripeptide--D-alanyl-D-alanine ligase [Acidisoma cellulosilyticum]MCB8878805.1 UDP-N-acetylmuramoyl-tripeptide--D-alanyl-D-alanine ligase [Acidisoma cellulosilyticum]
MTDLWTPEELIAATGGRMAHPFAANGLSIDTRTVAKGDLFVALHGENRDGHAFVASALSAGAGGALVDHDVPDVLPSAALLRVGDTLDGLTALGRFARDRFTGKLVAVTGSVGKTTTKEMLRRILAAEAPTHAAVASYNNHWGVPLTLARMPRDSRFCVAEIGMNHPGEIAPLAALARPHVAVITNVASVHIGHMGSLAAIAAEKAAILSGLEPGGIAVLPADSPEFATLAGAAGAHRVIRFGKSETAKARLVAVNSDADGASVSMSLDGMPLSFRLAAPGEHMALNAVAAIAAAVAMGLDPHHASAALDGFSAVSGRGARRRLTLPDGEALLLDESYNASGPSVRAALAVLALQPARRRIAVLGDMRELGEASAAEHLALLPDVIAHADLLFACGPEMKRLYESVPEWQRAAHTLTSAELAPLVVAALRAEDAILVKGSLGSRMAIIINALPVRAETEEPG